LIKKTYENGVFKEMTIDVNDLYDITIKADGSEEWNV
jgi:hypothetical protein